ncbi:MAG: hypothetical protein GY927_14620 [bacterium]|nr:hypothetical protein [bacterium]
MRYPIYIFLLMSGFFYLTGNPFSEETSKSGSQGKVVQLKYGRQVNTSASVDKPAEMQPGAVAIAQTPARVITPAAVSTPENKSFATGKAKRFKDPARKPLDWNVFGNKRKNTALTVPVRTRSQDQQDEIDAPGIVDEPKQARGYNPRMLASKNGKYKRAKLKRQELKARRAARKARKRKRLARLKRRSKGSYRIARKSKKKSIRKKNVSHKPRRKKFGFSFVGPQGRLSK